MENKYVAISDLKRLACVAAACGKNTRAAKAGSGTAPGVVAPDG